MNELIVDVKLWGNNVGSLYWDKDAGAAVFDYERKFIRSGLDISPIVMPLGRYSGEPYQFLENRNNCFKGLPGLLADSLPDAFGNQIINEWFASRGLSGEEITPMDRLCYVGQRAMGALEFEPSQEIEGINESSILHINELTSLARSVFADREKFQAQLNQEDTKILEILKVGTSAGGAKPKAIIAYNDVTGEVRSGQVQAPGNFGYWLLKFDGGTYSEHSEIADNPQGIGNIEYAYYLMAKDCGIEMTECRLLIEGDSHHFMTKRFDRTEAGEKIHVQTLAGIAHYDRDQRHSYEETFRIMRSMGLSYPDQEQLYKRMVFNVMTRNHDDHTKNFSFLMDKSGKWDFAPAYDLCYSYTPGGKWTNRHQMSLNSKQDNFTHEDLVAVAHNMGIRNSQAIIEQVQDTVATWKEYAIESGVKIEHSKVINDNLLLFTSKAISIPDMQEQDFLIAIKEGDFIKLSSLNDKGYKPSANVLKSIIEKTTSNTLIAVQKIFGVEIKGMSFNDIKLVQSDNSIIYKEQGAELQSPE